MVISLRFLTVLHLLVCAVLGELHFVAVGDWGTGSTEQFEVSEALNVHCGAQPGGCDFIMSLGDNFYGDGMTSPDDERFDTRWRDVYTGDNIRDLVWYMSVGNHDHTFRNGELHQVEFGKNESLWYLPWLWYDVIADLDTFRVHFLAADTPSLLTFKHNVTEQQLFINDTLRDTEADWVIVFGHHPMYSAGDYFGYPRLHADIEAIMEETGAQLYLCGHDHNMQHLVRNDTHTFDHVINGASGRGLYSYRPFNENWVNERGWRLEYFAELHGFTAVTVDESSLKVDHYTYNVLEDGAVTPELIYSFVRTK